MHSVASKVYLSANYSTNRFADKNATCAGKSTIGVVGRVECHQIFLIS